MFSVQQKREIADAVQKILRATNHPELPTGEIQFHLHVSGAESWSWADIRNNGAVPNPTVNPWNETQERKELEDDERYYTNIANVLYTTYCKAVGGKAFNGDPLPDWKTFRTDPAKKIQSDAWIQVAIALESI